MSTTKNALSLLEKVSDKKDVFLDVANAYVADKLNIFYSVENYVFLKDDGVTPFKELPEFDNLRKNVAKIEKADKVIDEFFEISDDVDKIIKYLDSEMLISYVEVEGANEVQAEEEVSFEEQPSNRDSELVLNISDDDYESSDDEKVVGIYKENLNENIVWGNEESDDSGFDDIITEDNVPAEITLFADDTIKTETEDLLDEANVLLKEASNYVFIGCNPHIYLSKRFEFYRIKYAMKNITDGAEPESEIEIIKNELTKIKSYIKHKAVLSIQMIEHDMSLVEKVFGLLKEFDESLYPPGAMPNIDELLGYIDSLCDYDVKSTLMYKFYMSDTISFLKTIYKNCSGIELDKNKRLEKERDRIEKESFDAIMELEREYYAVKKSLKNKLLGGKNSYASKRKELEVKFKDELDVVEKEISELVAKDTKLVGKNMKLYARIEAILKNNIVCFKLNK